MDNDVIELMDYFKVLWKRKWFIGIFTLAAVAAAVVLTAMTPKVWDVEALISSDFTEALNITRYKFIETIAEAPIVTPKTVVETVNQSSLDGSLPRVLKLDPVGFPSVRAELVRGTRWIKFSVREKDIEKAKLVLNSLINHYRKVVEERVEIKYDQIDSEVLGLETEIKNIDAELAMIDSRRADLQNQIPAQEKKLGSSSEQWKKTIDEMNASSLKIGKILEDQKKAGLEGTTEVLQGWLYLNSLVEQAGQQRAYLDGLRSMLQEMKEEYASLKTKKRSLADQREYSTQKMAMLRERKDLGEQPRIIKEPGVAGPPVSPRRRIIVPFAGVFGFLLSTMIALLLEGLKRKRAA